MVTSSVSQSLINSVLPKSETHQFLALFLYGITINYSQLGKGSRSQVCLHSSSSKKVLHRGSWPRLLVK